MSGPLYLTLDELEGKKEKWVKIKRGRFMGQMKLFISTTMFLTKLNLRKDVMYTILYIGSAPGSNFYILLKFLKNYKFDVHLFDPNPHDRRLSTLSNVTIHSQLFTSEMYSSWSNIKNLILISDIRSVNKNKQEPNLQNLITDYKIQFGFYDAIKPTYACFKIRYPYPDEIGKDFKLDIPLGCEYLQICTGDSNERRLILTYYQKDKKTITYKDCVDSEEMMAYYNNYKIKEKNYIERVFRHYMRKMLLMSNIDLDLNSFPKINTLLNTISIAIRDDKVKTLPFLKKFR